LAFNGGNMKYLLIISLLGLIGCSKHSGVINGKDIQYKDSLFTDTLTIYRGERAKSYSYDELKTVEKVTKTGEE